MAKGTHHGACHDLEIEWGRLVQKLVPSAERVRFTGSGTEATLMAPAAGAALHRPAEVPQVSRATSTAGTTPSRVRPTRLTTRTACPACRTRSRRVLRRGAAQRPQPGRGRAESRSPDRRRDPGADRRPLGWRCPIRGEFLKGLRELCTKLRPRADLRRGDYRLPRFARRCPRLLRRHART